MSDFMYVRILQAVNASPWAILPEKLAVIRDLLAYRAMGYKLTEEEVQERLAVSRNQEKVDVQLHPFWFDNPYYGARDIAAANGRSVVNAQNTAVIPIVGTIIPRGGMFTEASGAVSVQGISARFRSALKDPDVSSIVFDVDSPGGQVDGVEELSSEIYKARGQKPITAVVNTLAASAAYWIATAADEMVITPSGEVGSIGVFAMHQDISEMVAAQGVKVNLISAGKYKTEGNPFEPLDEEARAAIQKRVDEYYGMFVNAVARNRGAKRSDVRGGFGEGRTVGAKEAVALGMADRVGTLAETVQRMGNGRRRRRSAMAGKKLEIEKAKGA